MIKLLFHEKAESVQTKALELQKKVLYWLDEGNYPQDTIERAYRWFRDELANVLDDGTVKAGTIADGKRKLSDVVREQYPTSPWRWRTRSSRLSPR